MNFLNALTMLLKGQRWLQGKKFASSKKARALFKLLDCGEETLKDRAAHDCYQNLMSTWLSDKLTRCYLPPARVQVAFSSQVSCCKCSLLPASALVCNYQKSLGIPLIKVKITV